MTERSGATFNGQDRELLVRLDERTKGMQKSLMDLTHEELDRRYVPRSEFSPVAKLTYGAAGLILTAVVVAIVALVLK